MPLTQSLATQLIQSGRYLGYPPKFDVNDIVIYRAADFNELGFYAEPAERFQGQQFKILDMWQTILGLPVLDIVWQYDVAFYPVNARNFLWTQTFVEPQLCKLSDGSNTY